MTAPHPLLCHPSTPCPAVQGLTARVERLPEGGVRLTYWLAGDLVRLRLPGPGPRQRSDGLWRHTCFEAFVAGADTSAYCEFNFSPSGAWAAYAFSDYREGMTPLAMLAPEIGTRRVDAGLELAVTLPADVLPPVSPLRLGISAVIETADGGIAYWALGHAPGQPDFHHPDTFILDLP